MIEPASLRIAILIVGYRNSSDLQSCISALARLDHEPQFDVFICENGGRSAFDQLCEILEGLNGLCIPSAGPASDVSTSSRLVETRSFALKNRAARVIVGRAERNLGYAGGVNVLLEQALTAPDYSGVWVLNPDADPDPHALKALVEHSSAANKGMVGSTIVSSEDVRHIHCRAGHRWRKWRTSLALIGLGESTDAPVQPTTVEATLDGIAGASMYVTRDCINKIGPMDERFFLYYEDADWSIRAKAQGLGYAPNSIVPHRGGTTIGSARRRAERSRLSVYLESRNHLHFVRMHWFRYLPLAIVAGMLDAMLFLLVGSPRNATAAIEGLLAGIRGETGQPRFHTADEERA